MFLKLLLFIIPARDNYGKGWKRSWLLNPPPDLHTFTVTSLHKGQRGHSISVFTFSALQSKACNDRGRNVFSFLFLHFCVSFMNI